MNWEELKERLPHREKWIDSLASKEKIAQIKLDLAGHAGVKMLLDELRSRIDGLNLALLHKEDMTHEARLAIFAERDTLRSVLLFFSNAQTDLDSVQNALNNLQRYDKGTTTSSPYGA